MNLISTFRYPNRAHLEAAARNAHFVAYTSDRDDKGFFFTSYEQDPRIVAMCEEFDAKARANPKRVATGADVRAKRIDAEIATARAPRGAGITAAIRAWVHANPQATKVDAQAHFSHLNPGTVGVQFGRAKRGEA